jgi:hypothetical protein
MTPDQRAHNRFFRLVEPTYSCGTSPSIRVSCGRLSRASGPLAQLSPPPYRRTTSRVRTRLCPPLPCPSWEFCNPSLEGPPRPAQLLAAAMPTGADNAFDAIEELQVSLPRMQAAVPCRLGCACFHGVLRK